MIEFFYLLSINMNQKSLRNKNTKCPVKDFTCERCKQKGHLTQKCSIASESNVEEEKPVSEKARLKANNVEVFDKQAKLCDQCSAQMKPHV
ncbi:hypothetical protein BpHYR1_030665 [Brachionus plicatilis]|uniref:CCHC-type domain-containing protein n=1 Tax=Brachionus plicatilis TaxID=10195 RepID=A0A3M7PDX3_BRAPC|nr:hypothetical protein BpHYR1_030665 [Brachionus plicatilis]